MAMVFVLGILMVLGAVLVAGMAFGDAKPRAGVGRSIAVLEAMSQAPEQIRADLDKPFGERVLEPLQKRTLAIGRRLTGADSAERVRRKLDFAGNPRDWSIDRVVSVKVLGASTLVVVALAASIALSIPLSFGFLAVAAAFALGFFMPDLYLYQRTYDRSQRIQRDLPDAIDLMTISVEAGLGFDAAVQQVARNTEGPVADEFSRVLREMQIGKGRSEALRSLADRTNVGDLKTFVSAMVQAESFGIPIAQVLRVQSGEMRVRRRQRAETKAQQVPVKITVPLIFFILPCLFVAVMGPAAIQIMDNSF